MNLHSPDAHLCNRKMRQLQLTCRFANLHELIYSLNKSYYLAYSKIPENVLNVLQTVVEVKAAMGSSTSPVTGGPTKV